MVAGGVALVLTLSTAASAAAQTGSTQLGPETNLPLPRYVSLRSSEINVRRGPGLSYPKDWVFKRAGLPVRVIAEYGDWRRILDSDNAGGWVYHALISGRRTVLVTAPEVVIREEPSTAAPATAEVHQGVIAKLDGCVDSWCEISVEDVTGWAPSDTIWGVGPEDMQAEE
ncbi:aspartyl-trna synthetase [Rhodobacteraceae bacterium NNCM2]|nr:aspartyl-trna synthetase [Coraliihabitans acroporae]